MSDDKTKKRLRIAGDPDGYTPVDWKECECCDLHHTAQCGINRCEAHARPEKRAVMFIKDVSAEEAMNSKACDMILSVVKDDALASTFKSIEEYRTYLRGYVSAVDKLVK